MRAPAAEAFGRRQPQKPRWTRSTSSTPHRADCGRAPAGPKTPLLLKLLRPPPPAASSPAVTSHEPLHLTSQGPEFPKQLPTKRIIMKGVTTCHEVRGASAVWQQPLPVTWRRRHHCGKPAAHTPLPNFPNRPPAHSAPRPPAARRSRGCRGQGGGPARTPAPQMARDLALPSGAGAGPAGAGASSRPHGPALARTEHVRRSEPRGSRVKTHRRWTRGSELCRPPGRCPVPVPVPKGDFPQPQALPVPPQTPPRRAARAPKTKGPRGRAPAAPLEVTARPAREQSAF